MAEFVEALSPGREVRVTLPDDLAPEELRAVAKFFRYLTEPRLIVSPTDEQR